MSRTSTATTLSRVDAVADVTVRNRSGEASREEVAGSPLDNQMGRIRSSPESPGTWSRKCLFRDRFFAHRLTADRRRINDLLATGDFSGRHWVRAGMLLDLVQEGGLLAHDRDADFGLLREDLPRLLHVLRVDHASSR